MHLKLHIESLSSLLLGPDLYSSIGQTKVRQEHSVLWKYPELYRLLEHHLCGHAKDQGDVTCAGSSTDLQRGWLCSTGWLWHAGYSLGLPRLPHRALELIHVCLLASPLPSLRPGVCRALEPGCRPETQSLPPLQALAREKLILGPLGHHQLTWLCGCSFPTDRK